MPESPITTASASLVARFSSAIRSPLAGVPLPAWQKFVAALEVQRMDAVSSRGGLGSYDLRPRRLEELGYVQDLRRQGGKARGGQPQVYVCRFRPPLTQERFLKDPTAQMEALARSMRLYEQELHTGALQRPKGLSLAGVLAILHSGGRGALAQVADQGTAALFTHTRAVYERAQGAF